MPIHYHPKPKALAAIRAQPCATIEASAGTGKTHLLVHLIVDLVLDGVPIEDLLVVTFTEKATHELSRRVRGLLTELLDACRRGSDHAAPVAPGVEADRQTTPGTTPNHWRLGMVEQARLEDALFAVDRTTIATIHGFCQKVLTEYAFAHGRLFRQQVIDRTTVFRSVWRTTLRTRIARDPDLQGPLKAWLACDFPIDALETLLVKAHEACQAGARLGPPFDAGALHAAVTALGTFPDNPCTTLDAARIHGGVKRALKERIDKLWQAARQVVQNNESIYDFLATVEQWENSKKWFPYLRERREILQQCHLDLDRCLADLDAAIVPLSAALVSLYLPLVTEPLARHKRDAGLFDFQDLLSLVCERLEGSDGERLAGLLRRRYRVALIDEFQDTDTVQWRIFKRIFVDSQGQNPIYIIGDPKQAIYGFRGADVNTYLQARDHLATLGAPPFRLVDNFRSTPAIIDACNVIFSGTPDAPFFTGGVGFDAHAQAGRPDRRFIDAGGQDLSPVVLLKVHPTEGNELRSARVRPLLCQHIADEIAALLAQPPALVDGDADATTGLVRPSDIFVLTRTGHESQMVGQALQAAGIPHTYYRQEKLFATEEALQVRHLLAAIDSPTDRSLRFFALISPFFSLSLGDILQEPAYLDAGPLAEQLHHLRALAEQRDYERLFARIVDDSAIVRRGLFFGERDRDERIWTNVSHVFEVLLDEIGRKRPPLGEVIRLLDGFIAGVKTPQGQDDIEQRLHSDRQAVQVMTIHKAKGLQAKVVFLFGGFTRAGQQNAVFAYQDPLAPEGASRCIHIGAPRDDRIRAAITDEAAAEEQRLIYVALTRAQGRLYLPYFPTATESDARSDDDQPDAEAFSRMDGCHRHLNRQLRRVLTESCPGFELRSVLCPVTPAGPTWTSVPAPPQADGRPVPTSVPQWQPDPQRLVVDLPGPQLAKLRLQHLGPVTTSYTRLKQQAGAEAIPPRGLATTGEIDEVIDEGILIRPDPLPGGSRIGIFLHEALELAPLDTVACAENATVWGALPVVSTLFDRLMGRHEVPLTARAVSIEIVYTALTRPLPLDETGNKILPGVATLARAPLREMEFLYPDGQGGYVTGVIDLVFEADGRVFALDWKSDRVGDRYDLHQHTQQHYDLQAQLYAHAIARTLTVNPPTPSPVFPETFGGIIYVYLRRPPGRGEVFLRPSNVKM